MGKDCALNSLCPEKNQAQTQDFGTKDIATKTKALLYWHTKGLFFAVRETNRGNYEAF